MRRSWDPTFPTVVAAIVMLAGTLAATGGLSPGQWRGKLGSDPRSVRLELRLAEGVRQTSLSTDVPASELDGFDPAAFRSSGAPLRLTWKRDAGTFVLEGQGGRHAGGNVRFEPNAAFEDRWRELGFGTLENGDLLRMAIHGVHLADAERLKGMGYTPVDTDTLIRLGSEPGSVKWLEEAHAMGLRLEIEDLFRLHSHGVSMSDVRAFETAGIPFDVDNLIRLESHGVDAAYVKGMIDAGVGNDDLEGILRLHAHGVPTEYVAKVRSSGYSELDVDDIVRLHDQGVDSGYVRGLVESRLTGMTLDDIVRLHAHGVPADYVRAIVAIDAGRDADDVLRLHGHGVSAEFVRSFVASGRRDPTVDDVIHAAAAGPASIGDPAETNEGR
jgi:hypothetical protein